MCNLQPTTLPDIESAYASVTLLLKRIVHTYQNRHGGDYDELLAEADEGFMHAYATWEPSKGRLSTWTWHKVNSHLLNLPRQRQKFVCESLTGDVRSKPRFNLRAFLFELGEDAADVVGLVLESPLDIIQLCREQASEGIVTKRWALVRFLKDLGWTKNRIVSTFNEIREALQ